MMKIFMRKNFMVHHHPQNIFNIKLFPNYGIYTEVYIATLQLLAKITKVHHYRYACT